jgi:hypothetical protein
VALQQDSADYLRQQPRIRWRILSAEPLRISGEAATHTGGWFGPLAAMGVAEEAGSALIRAGAVKDPAVALSELFVKAATGSNEVLEKDPAAIPPGSPESKTWPTTLDFRTRVWSAWYPPFEDNYSLTYEVVARLLRTDSGSDVVLWKGSCRFMNGPRDGPTWDQLIENQAKGLNRLLREATAYCAAELAKQLRSGPGQFQPVASQFGLRPVAAATPEQDQPTPPAVEDEQACMRACVVRRRSRLAPNPGPTTVACSEDQTPELCCRWTTCVDAPSVPQPPAP